MAHTRNVTGGLQQLTLLSYDTLATANDEAAINEEADGERSSP